jgi:hypothetical protein
MNTDRHIEPATNEGFDRFRKQILDRYERFARDKEIERRESEGRKQGYTHGFTDACFVWAILLVAGVVVAYCFAG